MSPAGRLRFAGSAPTADLPDITDESPATTRWWAALRRHWWTIARLTLFTVLTAVLAFLATDRSLVNAHDENGYTPIHAAASYGHVDLLRTLCKNHGGDANVEDFEGDTPLFVVENVETARVLVEELGAKVGHRNKEGLTVSP